MVLCDSFALSLMLLFMIPKPFVNDLFMKIYFLSQQLNTVSRRVAVSLLLDSLQSHELISRLAGSHFAVLSLKLVILGLIFTVLLRKSLFGR
jgi:hypothetical protein